MEKETEQQIVIPDSDSVWSNLTDAAKGYAMLLKKCEFLNNELVKAKAEIEALKKSKE